MCAHYAKGCTSQLRRAKGRRTSAVARQLVRPDGVVFLLLVVIVLLAGGCWSVLRDRVWRDSTPQDTTQGELTDDLLGSMMCMHSAVSAVSLNCQSARSWCKVCVPTSLQMQRTAAGGILST